MKQIETATVIGTITTSGNASVVVTSAYMSNSPKTVSVAVLELDDADAVAEKIRNALAYDADVASEFLVSGSDDDVVLTAHVAKANDTTLNISIDNGTCAGLTAAPTSTNTQAGDGLTNAYATLAEYKSWISMRGQDGTVSADTSDDSVIEILLEAASRHIDKETGQRFYLPASDETRYYTAIDTMEAKIEPLAVCTSVSIDTSGARTYSELASTFYDLLPANAPLNGEPYTRVEINRYASTSFFPATRNGIRVIGKFGWGSCPSDIKEATLSIAQSLNGARSGQTTTGRVIVTSAGIVIRPEDIPIFAQNVIKQYRDLT